MKPKGSGILPVALHKGKLYFLMGKENPMEDTAKGWSDFGGGLEGESVFASAVRECAEETSGFFGSAKDLHRHIKKHGGFYKIEKPHYTLHIIHIDYDPMLPVYYNNNHAFLWKRMNQKMLNASKLFEKIEIEWICEDDLKSRMRDYRHFFRETVDRILHELPKIRTFIKKCNKKCKTRTNRKSSRKHNRTIRGG
jgi:hypothetical protein